MEKKMTLEAGRTIGLESVSKNEAKDVSARRLLNSEEIDSHWKEIDVYIKEWKKEFPKLSEDWLKKIMMGTSGLIDVFEDMLKKEKDRVDSRVKVQVERLMELTNDLNVSVCGLSKFDYDKLIQQKLQSDQVWKYVVSDSDRNYIFAYEKLVEAKRLFNLDCQLYGVDLTKLEINQIKQIINDYRSAIALKNIGLISGDLKGVKFKLTDQNLMAIGSELDEKEKEIKFEKRNKLKKEHEDKIAKYLEYCRQITDGMFLVRGQFVYLIEDMVRVLRREESLGLDGVAKASVEASIECADDKDELAVASRKALFSDTLKVLRFATMSTNRFADDISRSVLNSPNKTISQEFMCLLDRKILDPIHKWRNRKNSSTTR